MIFGNHFKDIPQPHRFRWSDNNEERDVVVKITSWIGYSPGATHYYVEVKEEDNPVWDSTISDYRDEANGWTVCWDHPEEYKGQKFEHRLFLNKTLARAWAGKIVKKFFPDHNLRIDGGDDQDTKFLRTYLREGD